MVKITKQICPETKWNIKCPYNMTPIGITVHNTANDASALSEIKYMISNNAETSFHYAVDDKEAVQGLPLDRNGWHASDGNGTGNRKTIAIEICYSKSGGARFDKAEENAAELIASLCKKYGWTINNVKRHYDYAPNKKYCPHRTMDKGWTRFLNMIQEKMGEKPSSNNVNVYYRVKTQKHGWLPEVKNLEDYAGWQGSPITDVAIRVDKGSIKYRVSPKGQNFLPYVTGYNTKDSINGYAGNGKPIDRIEVYYYTPNDIRPYKKIYYRANGLPWQSDNDKNSKMDGYAGIIGQNITKLEMYIK